MASKSKKGASQRPSSVHTFAEIQERSRVGTVFNKLEARGYLLKQSSGVFKIWQQRWFILHGRRIYYFREDPKLDPGQEYKNFIELHHTTKVIVPEEDSDIANDQRPCKFILENQPEISRSYTLCAMGSEKRNTWIKAIESVLADLREEYERKSLQRMRQEEETKERHRLYTRNSTGTEENSSLPTPNALTHGITTIIDVVVEECVGLGKISDDNGGNYSYVCGITLEQTSGVNQYARTSYSMPDMPNPQWHEDFTFVTDHPFASTLEFNLYAKGLVKHFMGRVRLPLAPFFLQFFSTSSSSSTANGGITKTVLEVDDKWWELSPRPGVAKDLTRVRGALHLKLQLSLPASTVDTIGPPLPLLLGEFGLPCGALRQRVDSGDIVLVSYSKKKMKLGAKWDHVGLVVRKPPSEPAGVNGAGPVSTGDTSITASATTTHSDTTLEDQLFLLEAVQEGFRLHPLHRAIEQYQNDGRVAIRRLKRIPPSTGEDISVSGPTNVIPNPAGMRQELWEFARRVDGKSYEPSTVDILSSVLPRETQTRRRTRSGNSSDLAAIKESRLSSMISHYAGWITAAGLKSMGVLDTTGQAHDYPPSSFAKLNGVVMTSGFALDPERSVLSKCP